jgi:hypothetical protein
LSEWDERDGDVLWWKFPIDEPPYVGTPNDLGFVVNVVITTFLTEEKSDTYVGGWPGYHTHWTPIELPEDPI